MVTVKVVIETSPFPQATAKALALSSVDFEVCRAEINSTSFCKFSLISFTKAQELAQSIYTITGTGLKKCKPVKGE